MSNIQLKPSDLAIDAQQMLHDTEIGMAFLIGAGQQVPEEAEQLAGLCRRVIVAERTLAEQATPARK